MSESNRNVLLSLYGALGLVMAVLLVLGVAVSVLGPLMGIWTLSVALYTVYGAAKERGQREGREQAQEAVQAALEAMNKQATELAAHTNMPGMEMAHLIGGGPMDGEDVPAPLGMLRNLKMMLPHDESTVAAAMACFDDDGNPIGRYEFVDLESNVMRWVPIDDDE